MVGGLADEKLQFGSKRLWPRRDTVEGPYKKHEKAQQQKAMSGTRFYSSTSQIKVVSSDEKNAAQNKNIRNSTSNYVVVIHTKI
jgi:hypothetical protein